MQDGPGPGQTPPTKRWNFWARLTRITSQPMIVLYQHMFQPLGLTTMLQLIGLASLLGTRSKAHGWASWPGSKRASSDSARNLAEQNNQILMFIYTSWQSLLPSCSDDVLYVFSIEHFTIPLYDNFTNIRTSCTFAMSHHTLLPLAYHHLHSRSHDVHAPFRTPPCFRGSTPHHILFDSLHGVF